MLFIPTLILALTHGFLFQSQATPQASMKGSAESLVAAELAFAKQADAEDTRAAFLAVLDEDGLLFRPGPVNGRAWLTPRKPDATKLSWYPAFVEVSRAGDLGYSTGPYEWRPGAGSDEVAHGHFVSIWGWKDGTWKLLMDTGVAHSAPPAEIPLFKPQPPPRKTSGTGLRSVSAETLALQEHSFALAVTEHGLATAYRRFAADGLRYYREQAIPLTLSRDAFRTLGSSKDATTRTCAGTCVSKSGDLGYAYGFVERAGIDPTAKPVRPGKSVFLHLWKRAHPGGWKLVLDIETPLPPGKPQS